MLPLTLSDETGWVLPTRQDIFDRMLARYLEAQETLHRGGLLGSGDGPMLMPNVWNLSYRKLEWLLRRYRAEPYELVRGGTTTRPFAHLRGFYFLRSERLALGCRGCGEVGARIGWHKHRGQQFRTDERILQVTRRHWVDVDGVRAGLVWLDERWDDGTDIGEPMLPDDMIREQGSKDAIGKEAA